MLHQKNYVGQGQNFPYKLYNQLLRGQWKIITLNKTVDLLCGFCSDSNNGTVAIPQGKQIEVKK